MKKVKAELEKIGYNVFSKVLCSSDYGIPQQRKRLYIVAFHEKLKVKNFSFPEEIDDVNILKNILIKSTENKINGNYRIDRDYTVDKTKKEPSSNLIRIGEIGLGRQGERIYSIYGQATTLSSQGGGLGGKTGMYLIRNKVRKLYPRECARLMGFPDTYMLADTQDKNYKQFGNSVVVDVIQYITKEIIEKIQGEE